MLQKRQLPKNSPALSDCAQSFVICPNIGWGLKQLGRSSAVTVLLLLFLLIVCAQYFRLLNKWEEEK